MPSHFFIIRLYICSVLTPGKAAAGNNDVLEFAEFKGDLEDAFMAVTEEAGQ